MANVPKSVILDAKRKAAELENFDCSKRKKGKIVLRSDSNTNPDADTEAALKILNLFKNLPLGTMNIEEQQNALTNLLQ
jgi:DNA mismatch repair ATPase MutS